MRAEGAHTVAARFGIDHSTVRVWAAAHSAHGLAGLARRFSHYDAAFKRFCSGCGTMDCPIARWLRSLTSATTAALPTGRDVTSAAGWRRWPRAAEEDHDRCPNHPPPLNRTAFGPCLSAHGERLPKKIGGHSAGTAAAEKAQAVQALRPLHSFAGLLAIGRPFAQHVLLSAKGCRLGFLMRKVQRLLRSTRVVTLVCRVGVQRFRCSG